MRNTNYLTYIKKNNEKRYLSWACFGIIGNDDNEFSVKINLKAKTNNHVVILSEDEIKQWLDEVNGKLGGIESVIHKKTSKSDFYEIKINQDLLIGGKCKSRRLATLSAIRYLYESPYNLILKKAFYLADKYKEFSLLEWAILSHFGESYGGGHCLCSLDATTTYKGVELNPRMPRFTSEAYLKCRETISNNSLFNELPQYDKETKIQITNIMKNEEGFSSR